MTTRWMTLLLFLLISSSLSADALTPQQAVDAMKLPEGFKAVAVATEPMIRQPLSISFDPKGRLWVLQYLQYPNPAGLKPLKQDQYLRTIWDKVLDPPPKGVKGLDRITILSQPDANGAYTKSKDFLSGLNMASGFALADDGVYVTMPPYLLFYPDRNHDDVPDSDPEVLLKGFGMDDTHSLANSLQLGPDGWLYGASGSTSTSRINGIEFQQGIWRYHPLSKRFELFSEGGGNTYGLDFDHLGNAIAGTNWGGFAMLHQVQGSYHIKGFSKHGPLHNPHTYGYFDHVPYKDFKGGHVTCGGIIYDATRYPKEYHQQYIAGNLLSNAIYWHHIEPNGSTYTARHGGDLLTTSDVWFRPIDCLLGPDDCVYIVDWYDKRAAHLDPIDNWDKTNGRVYRIDYGTTPRVMPNDLRVLSSSELIDLLNHSNKWWREQAREILAHRHPEQTLPRLIKIISEESNHLALEALWTAHRLDPKGIPWDKVLSSKNQHVRAWGVRLLADEDTIPENLHAQLLKLAENDSAIEVRLQLACSAKRLPGMLAIEILTSLIRRDLDSKDPYLPMLIWWGIEAKAITDQEQLLNKFVDTSIQASTIFQHTIASRLARRWTSENTPETKMTIARWFGSATPTIQSRIIEGLDQGLFPNQKAGLDPAFQSITVFLRSKTDLNSKRLLARLGDADVIESLASIALDAKRSNDDRQKSLATLVELKASQVSAIALNNFRKGTPEAVRVSALEALQTIPTVETGKLLAAETKFAQGMLRTRLIAALISRENWVPLLFDMIDDGSVKTTEISLVQLRPWSDGKHSEIEKRMLKHFGLVGKETPGEKQARISWLNMSIPRHVGRVDAGKIIFEKTCVACHKLHGKGGDVGPDLTTADRKNRTFLLTHIVDPSLAIREEYLIQEIILTDGRKLSAIVQPSKGDKIRIVQYVANKPEVSELNKSLIEEMLPSKLSLMPEKLLDTYTDQEVADLFAFVGSDSIAADATKKRILLISGSNEYKSDESLKLLSKSLQQSGYSVLMIAATSESNLPGLEELDRCDLAIFFTRRLTIEGEQLERVKKVASSSIPIIGIRTASHGFQHFLEMDKTIFGGSYANHYQEGPNCKITVATSQKVHPILQGVDLKTSVASLYKNPQIAPDATVILNGSIPDHNEPLAWARTLTNSKRVFYTSLGHPSDFKDVNFIRLLNNAVVWCLEGSKPK
jgi:putative membrane-bound dehydrogenase-like protein